MDFDIIKLLFSIGYVLDLVEVDLLGTPSNHSKRVTYISSRIGEYLGLSEFEIIDLSALAILHDNGISKYSKKRHVDRNTGKIGIEDIKNHCIIGEENILNYPFITDVKNIIKYHHENYSGTGYFGLKGEEIPLMSQILALADNIDNIFNLKELTIEDRDDVIKYLRDNENILFSSKLCRAFEEVSSTVNFWLDLKDYFIADALNKIVPKYSRVHTWEDIRKLTSLFSNIIDSKSHFTMAHSSGLANKIRYMADFYKKDEKEKLKLLIAADLHDVGKLAISNDIINKPGKLTKKEMAKIKAHTYYTRMSIEHIQGFEDIIEWAANHHEKLDGSGYPYGKKSSELDFNSRLMGCLDIYQALREERPYRQSLSHVDSIKILRQMAEDGLIEKEIVNDIAKVFA